MDQFSEKLEDMISYWDLVDINPKTIKYTLMNRRMRQGHMVVKMN